MFKDAFERANSFDRDKVRDALKATDMQTFYGNIKFGPGGQNDVKVTSVRIKLLLQQNGLQTNSFTQSHLGLKEVNI